jgi:hypothetical protein
MIHVISIGSKSIFLIVVFMSGYSFLSTNSMRTINFWFGLELSLLVVGVHLDWSTYTEGFESMEARRRENTVRVLKVEIRRVERKVRKSVCR